MFWQSQGGGPGAAVRAAAGPGAATAAAAAGRALAGAARSLPTSRSCCAAARTASGACCPAALAPAPASPSSRSRFVVIWLASGFYRVLPDEVGVVLRFGAYNRTTQPGLNYHLPSPIETVLTPSVTRVNRTEIGYRNAEGPGPRRRHPPSAGRGADADRRREHRRHQLHGVLGDQERTGLSVQHPRPRGDGQIGRRERDARGRRRDPDRAGAVGRARQDRDRYAAPAAEHPRYLRRRDRDHSGAAAEGRSAGPGHRRIPRRAARTRRSRAAA